MNTLTLNMDSNHYPRQLAHALAGKACIFHACRSRFPPEADQNLI